MRNPTTNPTLMSANQNSSSPKLPTCTRLLAVNATIAISANTHGATDGKMPFRYCAAAVASAATTRQNSIHHSHPSANAAGWPMALPA